MVLPPAMLRMKHLDFGAILGSRSTQSTSPHELSHSVASKIKLTSHSIIWKIFISFSLIHSISTSKPVSTKALLSRTTIKWWSCFPVCHNYHTQTHRKHSKYTWIIISLKSPFPQRSVISETDQINKAITEKKKVFIPHHWKTILYDYVPVAIVVTACWRWLW